MVIGSFGRSPKGFPPSIPVSIRTAPQYTRFATRKKKTDKSFRTIYEESLKTHKKIHKTTR